MKKTAVVTIGVLTAAIAAALAQAPAPAGPPPALSTAELISLQALENQKGDAVKAKKDADEKIRASNEAEGKIARDFAQGHPGWQLNAGNFTVEKALAGPAGPAKVAPAPALPPTTHKPIPPTGAK